MMIDKLRIPERLVQLGPGVTDADMQVWIGDKCIMVIFEAHVGKDRFRSAFAVPDWEYNEQAVGEAIERAMGEFVEV